MAEQFKELTEFYRAYYDWVMSGCKNHPKFNENGGLCLNLNLFNSSYKVINQMKNQFIYAELDPIYPFNRNDDEYSNEVHHENPARIAWVKAHLNG